MHGTQHGAGDNRDDNEAAAVAGGCQSSGKTALVREKLDGVGYDRAVGHSAAETHAKAIGQDQHRNGSGEAGADHAESEKDAGCHVHPLGADAVIDEAAADHGDRSDRVGYGKDDRKGGDLFSAQFT